MRVVVAAIGQETNSFSPIPSPLAKFGRKPGPFFGQEAIDEYRDSRIPFAAFLKAAESWGADVVVPVVGRCHTGGPVEDSAFEFMSEKLLESIEQGCDCLLLDLHGAMVTVSGEDEGLLLERVRKIAPNLPIAVPWDFHGNMSARKVENVTIGVAYQTAPHVDIYETGERAARLMRATLQGEVKPVTAWGNVPVLGDSGRMNTSDPAIAELMKMARQAEQNPKVLACSVFGGCAKSDTYDAGPSCIVITDGDAGLAGRIRDDILSVMWDRRSEYLAEVEPLSQSIAHAKSLEASAKGPIILADNSDNCNSGGTNDDMQVISEAMAQGLTDVAVAPICDPEVAAAMHRAGNGGSLTVDLGNKVIPLYGKRQQPIRVTGRVSGLSNGDLVVTGPVFTGTRRDMGPCGVLDCGAIQFVVTSQRAEPFDLGIFQIVGIDPRTKKYLIMKGGAGFYPVYKPFAQAIIRCFGDGAVKTVNQAESMYRHLRRPIFPYDETVSFVRR